MSIPYEPGEPLTCQQIRELDILAIEHVGIPGLILMENAARSVAEFLHGVLVNPPHELVVILCGPGNNGGDGFVTARHLRNAGVQTVAVLAMKPAGLRGDAAINYGICQRIGMTLIDATAPEGLEHAAEICRGADVIVDAMLGTGATGAPRGTVADLVRMANAAPAARRIAIDIPSGLNADSGDVAEPCFKADATVTFVAAKIGFAKPEARRVLGRVVVADIGVPRNLIPGRGNSARGS